MRSNDGMSYHRCSSSTEPTRLCSACKPHGRGGGCCWLIAPSLRSTSFFLGATCKISLPMGELIFRRKYHLQRLQKNISHYVFSLVTR